METRTETHSFSEMTLDRATVCICRIQALFAVIEEVFESDNLELKRQGLPLANAGYEYAQELNQIISY